MRSRVSLGLGGCAVALLALLASGCEDNACIRQSDCPHGTHCSAELVCEPDSTDDGGSDGGELVDLGGVDLQGDLASSDLAGADLLSDLAGVDLMSTDLAGIDLTGVDLATGDLVGPDLAGVDLQSGDLAGVDLLVEDAADLSVGDAGGVDGGPPVDLAVPDGGVGGGVDLAAGGG